MEKLQKPKYVFMNEKLVPWNDAMIHIGTEAVTRGLNVFEGIKGYWQQDGRFAILELKQHYYRLQRSARLLHIPFEWDYEYFKNSLFRLIGTLLTREKDMWFRITLIVIEGHWGEGTKADLVITAFNQDKDWPKSINLGVSTWQRSTDVSLPARIKTSTNYQVSRLARIEGRANNYQDMVLLNQWGRVAETTGSCILIVRDGSISTPTATEGALESITVNIVEKLALSMGINISRRPVDRTELLISEEIALCGTLAELIPVKKIEHSEIDDDGPVFRLLRKMFFDIMRGNEKFPDIEFTYLPPDYLAQM